MQSHPYVIMEHQELIVQCLAVDDITIRMRSLELLAGMVNPDNAAQIIRELMRQTLSADGAYRHELITRILHVCSINKYENIHDFDWYIHVLVQLARVPGHTFHCRDSQPATGSSNAAPGSLEEARSKSHGVEVARQLVDIAVRVKSVRSVIVENMIDLLLEKEALIGAGASTLSEVFYAAAWISGEYIMEYLEDEEEDDEEDEEDKLGRIMDLVDEMLQPRTTTLPAHVQTVFIQNLLKFIAALADKAEEEEVEKLAQLILERIPTFVQSEHIEVQERAICLKYILLSLGLGLDALTTEERANRAFDSATASVSASQRLDILNSYFAERLAPVGAKAQRKVPLPSGLDLDEPIDEREASYLEAGGDVKASYDDDLEVNFVNGTSSSYSHRTFFGYDRDQAEEEEEEDEESSSNSEDAEEEKARQYAKEKERLRKDPFYLNNATFNSKNDNASLGVSTLPINVLLSQQI
jgi:AP-3 complex subunit delta-1